MSIIETGQKIIESYKENELLAKANIPIYLARCFTPHTFNSYNFLTYINSAQEFWKLTDSQQEFRTAYYGSKKMGVFSEAEFTLIKEISLDIGNLMKDFNRKTIPAGINQQLSSLPTIRILQQLKTRDEKLSSVLEIGGGSGMLGHMCHRLGFKYSNFDITQSFYTFNSAVFETLYKDKFTDTHLINAIKGQHKKIVNDNAITLIPWWNFVDLEFSLPKFKIVVMNHCFFEISRKAMAFILTRLANAVDGRVYLIVSEWGSREFTQLHNSFLKSLEQEFDFRIEGFEGDPKVNPNGTVLFSFQKTKLPGDVYSLPIEQRLSVQTMQGSMTLVTKLLKFFLQYTPLSIKTFLRAILPIMAAKYAPNILGNNEPNFSKIDFKMTPYTKDYNDLKILISEIENELGKPSYTEDEALGFYISRMDHA